MDESFIADFCSWPTLLSVLDRSPTTRKLPMYLYIVDDLVLLGGELPEAFLCLAQGPLVLVVPAQPVTTRYLG